MGGCGSAEEHPIQVEGVTRRLQEAALSQPPEPPEPPIELTMDGPDGRWTELVELGELVSALALRVAERCGVLPQDRWLVELWFSCYRLPAGNTVGQCTELCEQALITVRGVDEARRAAALRAVANIHQFVLDMPAAGEDARAAVLLACPADALNRPALHRYTPLHVAAWHGRERAAELLIRGKAAVCPTTDRLHTPLHLAAMRGHERLVGLLLEADCAVDPQDAEGSTPLQLAARYDDYSRNPIRRMLSDAGAASGLGPELSMDVRKLFEARVPLAGKEGIPWVRQVLFNSSAQLRDGEEIVCLGNGWSVRDGVFTVIIDGGGRLRIRGERGHYTIGRCGGDPLTWIPNEPYFHCLVELEKICSKRVYSYCTVNVGYTGR